MGLVYQCDANGFYVGRTEDYGGPMPFGCVAPEPPVLAGHIPRWTGKSWEQVENHVGESGYVNGEPFTVRDYGPHPEGWSSASPDPGPREKAGRLRARIAAVEATGERALRETSLALAEYRTPPPAAVARLKAVETEIAALRLKLKDMTEAAGE